MNSRHRKTLALIFQKPTPLSIPFSDIEALVVALGGEVFEQEGSRVKFVINGEIYRTHRPPPHKEAKHYQIRNFRDFLAEIKVKP